MMPAVRPVLALLASLGLACAGPPQPPVTAEERPHLGEEAWLAFRGEALGLEPAAVKARDGAVSEREPPLLEPGLAKEAALLWRDLCAACHGLDGRAEALPAEGPRPRAWGGFGARMGFFFGGDSMRAGLYRRIRDGGDAEGKPSVMPAWGQVLAREQIWALVRHIEGF